MKLHSMVALVLAGGIAVAAGASRADDAATAAKTEPAAKTPAVKLGDPATARWTATTEEAAATPANQKVLAGGKQATVTGEVVDVSCYLQLGKRGEAHVACGTKCIEHGEPVGLVDDKGKLYILFAEEHHPRRDGQVTLGKTLLPLLAKRVTATGMATETQGVRGLFLQAAEIDSMMSRAGGH